MKRLLTDPLTHFLVLGAIIFAVYAFIGDDIYTEPDDDTIIVDEEALLRFTQFRSRAFNEALFREELATMPEDELQLLIDDYVREEVLFREAIKLGMDQEDYIIRRRLVQKMEFLSDTGAQEGAALSAQELQDYFDANRDRYYVDPHATFTHVFFDADRHGWDEADRLARAWLDDHRNAPPAFEESIDHGDRFPFHLNYVERTPELVAAHFGDDAAEAIFACDLDTWQGPIRSTYGVHVVLVSARAEGRSASLDEVIDRVRENAIAEIREAIAADGIADVIDSYDVQIVYKRDFAQPL